MSRFFEANSLQGARFTSRRGAEELGFKKRRALIWEAARCLGILLPICRGEDSVHCCPQVATGLAVEFYCSCQQASCFNSREASASAIRLELLFCFLMFPFAAVARSLARGVATPGWRAFWDSCRRVPFSEHPPQKTDLGFQAWPQSLASSIRKIQYTIVAPRNLLVWAHAVSTKTSGI